MCEIYHGTYTFLVIYPVALSVSDTQSGYATNLRYDSYHFNNRGFGYTCE